uniref:Mucin-1 n=1 Tax=Panthera leo TaxID=9689 RepID=A0A8C8X7A0_PANLE
MTPRFLAPCFLLLLTGEGVEPVTSSNHKTSPQLSIRISFFFLSFSISNLQFNSCLEDPNTGYYQELQRNVSEWFLQVYNQEDFLGFSNIKFRYNSGRGPCGEGGSCRHCGEGWRTHSPGYVTRHFLPLLGPGPGYPAGASPSPWPPLTPCFPRPCVSAAGRTAGSWTSFRPAMPITL